jgi:hypothetical protein
MRDSIVAFDPGGTTGFAVWTPDNCIYTGQIEGLHHVTALWKFLEGLQPGLVIWEEFIYEKDHLNADLRAVEYIGVCRLWAEQRAVPTQVSSRAFKKFWDRRKLKALKLYKASTPHGMDALRHLLTYLVFTLEMKEYLPRLSSEGP